MPEFSKTDLELSMTLDGNAITTTPSKGAYTISVTCDKGATGYWDYDAWSVIVGNINEVKVKCAIAFQTGSPKFNEYIMAKSEVANSGVEKIEHEDTIQTGSNAKIDYRYVGANPNNYVCFGSEVSPCPSDNLYRIIGMIPTQSSENGEYENRVKLIKASNYMNSYWSGSTSITTNDWTKSTLNTNQLNNVYWNSLGKYQNYIEPAKWYLGEQVEVSFSAEDVYSSERKIQNSSLEIETSTIANIGLIYASDYAYAINKQWVNAEKCSGRMNWEDDCAENNWLYQGSNEWLLLTRGSTSDQTWFVYGTNGIITVSTYSKVNTAQFVVRPTFYLKTNVLYSKGDGSISNPFRISL